MSYTTFSRFAFLIELVYMFSFRSCDSSFGVGSLSNEDELSWFSSSHATELSEDAFKSDNNFSVHKANALKSISSTEHDDLNKKTVSMGDRMDYQTSDIDDPAAPGQLSFVKGPDMKTESREDLMPKEEVATVILNYHLFFIPLFQYSNILFLLAYVKPMKKRIMACHATLQNKCIEIYG